MRFAAVLDNNGKLIIAEYRKGIQNYWRDSSYLFHLDHLVPAIKKREFCTPYSKEKEEQQQEEIHFEIIVIDDNVRLAIASAK